MSVALTRGWAPYRLRADAPWAVVRRLFSGERLSKFAIVGMFTFMATRLTIHSAQTGHVTGLLLVASEALVVALTMVRRPAAAVDRTLVARLVTLISTFGPPLVRPASAEAVASDGATVLIAGIGLAFVLVGKLSLGRSFGLAPANRGVVSDGLYRFVRHPIYLGYLITHVGFMMANPVDWNLAILGAADVALLLRARYEERTLLMDPAYRDYTQRVRWRIVPGVF